MANRLIDISEAVKNYFKPAAGQVRARDFIRELPGATANVLGETARQIALTPVRVGADLADTARVLTGHDPAGRFNVPGLGETQSSVSRAKELVDQGNGDALGTAGAILQTGGEAIGDVLGTASIFANAAGQPLFQQKITNPFAAKNELFVKPLGDASFETVDGTKKILKTTMDTYDQVAKDPTIKPQVYDESGNYRPNVLKEAVDDYSQKLDLHSQGLGDQFRAQVGDGPYTPKELLKAASNMLGSQPTDNAGVTSLYRNDMAGRSASGSSVQHFSTVPGEAIKGYGNVTSTGQLPASAKLYTPVSTADGNFASDPNFLQMLKDKAGATLDDFVQYMGKKGYSGVNYVDPISGETFVGTMRGSVTPKGVQSLQPSALGVIPFLKNLFVDGKTAPVETTTTPPIAKPGVVGGVDITSYATDPQHESNVRKIYNSIPDNFVTEDISSYIKAKAPDSPIKAKDVLAAASKHEVDPRLVLAILQQDSMFGTKGVGARTRNPGNVGTTDSGKVTTFGSWASGIDAVASTLAKNKVK